MGAKAYRTVERARLDDPRSSSHLLTRTIVDGMLIALVRRDAACRFVFTPSFAGPTGSLVWKRYLQPQLGI
jgi:hypothetical protein